ncbi:MULTISPECIES: copper chaperone PCu(A)C [unclassified Halomonas]|uniref:copper chaperone PCu(A)C n=1 Tax=unclassified Halomonas TaxID=2609666 RepID=UPI0021E51351|nr:MULTISPECIES: copper chaperone PCu(A)C [unclassified Halomonas]UYG01018.1 copper chaperone PCu(A)C [Halomonas sp. GD1P12]WNL37920.1 copper chaperone PCu(A)C [Halomonas sp. PAMB 3232]WNL41236.1 copper chaperone PCu(A)C [Halomonas sp. PAMB 3264]
MANVLSNTPRPLVSALLGAAVLLGAASAQASDISVSNARLSLLPGNTPGAGYFDLENAGDEAVTLTGADTEAFEAVEMHESSEHEGMAHMQSVENVEVEAGETFSFAPRGHHLMFMERVVPLAVGDSVEVTLEFDGETLPVTFEVVSPTSL